MQVIINIILALAAIGGIVLGIINQLQIRRQMQRRLLVRVKQQVIQLPRIPDGQGGFAAASVHVFTIQVVNTGLTPVILKGTGMILPDGKLLPQGFVAERRDKQLPLELAPGADHEVHGDAYPVLKALKLNGNSDKVISRFA